MWSSLIAPGKGTVGYGVGRVLGRIRVRLEASKSRSGLHACRSIAVLVSRDGARVVKATARGEKPVYARGWAGSVEVEVPPGSYLVHARLVLNSQGKLGGRFRVYDHEGNLLLEAILRRRKVRRSRGDPDLGWVVERAVEALGLGRHVRRYNWRTGA